MNDFFRRTMFGNRKSQRGFSLIELGIVIAVIAVLATVVIFGRGFILAGRVTKGVDASNTIRKSAATLAGLQGGMIMDSGGDERMTLVNRGLLPASAGEAAGWEVSGSGNDAIVITGIRFDQVAVATGASNAVAIQFRAPNASVGQDILTAVRQDANVIAGGQQVAGVTCSDPTAVPPAATTNPVLCFFL